MTEPDVLNGRKAWTITFLLFLAQILNFFDKGVLGLAAASIMQELGLTPEQYGLVAASFFSLYAVSGVAVGFLLAGRIRSKTLIAILVLIWSLAQLPVVFFASLTTLFISRILLGIGEGPATPSATNACHAWFSSENRNMPTAVLLVGSTFGLLISAPLLSHIMVAYGWRSGFLVCSLLGITWLVLWLLFGKDGPDADNVARKIKDNLETPGASASMIPQIQLWRDPTIIGSILVGFCAYWVIGFTVAWQAPLIQLGLGFDAVTTGWLVSAISAVGAVLMMLLSFASQLLLKRGKSSRIARGAVNSVALLASGAAFILAANIDAPMTKLFFLAIGIGIPPLTFVLGPTIVSEVVPTAMRGRMLIVIYAAVTIAGFLSPLVAGRLIGSGGIAGYEHALLVNAGVIIVGGILGLLLLNPERSRIRLDSLIEKNS